MQVLWRSLAEDNAFSREAIEYVKRKYYKSSKVRQIMKCYIYDSGNLHQTIISCNEEMHATYHSRMSIIQSLVKLYKLHRIHKEQ